MKFLTNNDDLVIVQHSNLKEIKRVLEKISAPLDLIDSVDQAVEDNAFLGSEFADKIINADASLMSEERHYPDCAIKYVVPRISEDNLQLRRLLRRLTKADAPDRALDADLHVAFGFAGDGSQVPRYTGSTAAIDSLMQKLLPGFWESSGLCELTGHASIGPDYKPPRREAQEAAWPKKEFSYGFHADLGPEGGGPHRKCLARMHCIVQALIARRGQQP